MRVSPHRAIFDRPRRHGNPPVGAQVGAAPPNVATGAASQANQTAAGAGTHTAPPTLGALVDSIALNCDRLFIVDDVAFVVSFANDSLYSIDVSDPTNLSIIDTLTDSTNLDGAFDVVVDGDYAYVIAQNTDRVTVVDVSNPASMSVAGSLASASIDSPGGIAKVGNYVFTASSNGGGHIASVDVSTPASPTLTDTVTSGVSTACSIEIVGNYAYFGHLAASTIGYLDISDPTNLGPSLGPFSSGVSGSSNVTEAMVLLGNYLFTAGAGGTANGIYAFDVTSPGSPSFVSSLVDNVNYQGGRAIDAIGSSHVVLGCSAANKLQLFDVSNPAAMSLVDTISNAMINGVRDLQVYNGHVFTCSRASGSTFAAWSIT